MTVVEGLVGTVDLPCSTTSARHARRWTSSLLTEARFAAVREDCVLLVSELVANAVLHARTSVRVSVWHGAQRLHVEVTDFAPTPPRRRLPDRLSTTGRGLGLLDAKAVDWGVAVDGEVTTVWFDLDPRRPVDDVRAARWFARDWFGGNDE